MFILPVEHKLDWKNPPVATLVLIIINTLVFTLYQSHDGQKFNELSAFYSSSKLYEKEKQLFLDYREKKDPGFISASSANKQEEFQRIALPLMLDPQFDLYLKQYWQSKTSDDEIIKWQQDRKTFEEKRNELSSFKYGFIPAQPSAVTAFTHMFLHGGWSHLIGNMVFLFIFGFSLEIAFGRKVFLGLYLLSGLFAVSLFALVETFVGKNAYSPLLGASGAISGEMGMYLALFGTRRINFIYLFGFYFGHWRAPALWVFPIWVGKEILEWFTTASNIAHWAHAGGLLGGYFTVFLLKDRLIKIDYHYVDNVDDDAKRKEQLVKINQLIGDMKVDRAKSYCLSILNEDKDRLDIREKYFSLAKMTPESNEFHQAALDIFKLSENRAIPAQFFGNILQQYIDATKNPRALSGPICLPLCLRFNEEKDLKNAQYTMDRMLEHPFENERIPFALMSLGNLLHKQKNQKKSDYYFNQLLSLYPDSKEADFIKKNFYS